MATTKALRLLPEVPRRTIQPLFPEPNIWTGVPLLMEPADFEVRLVMPPTDCGRT
jgi:hypothetical protein